jgi:hypothetical protein
MQGVSSYVDVGCAVPAMMASSFSCSLFMVHALHPQRDGGSIRETRAK